MTNQTSARFNEVHAASAVVEYDSSWANCTGYFDGGVNAPVESGDIKASTCPQGRKILLVGTPVGTVVVFERYTGGGGPYVQNTPPSSLLEIVVGNGKMSDQQITNTLGFYEGAPNVGHLLENFLAQVKR